MEIYVSKCNTLIAGGSSPGNPDPDPRRSSIERAIRSLEKRIAEHQIKLDNYLRNPDAHDNLGHLQNAPNQQVRDAIIQGRVNHLQYVAKRNYPPYEVIKLKRKDG